MNEKRGSLHVTHAEKQQHCALHEQYVKSKRKSLFQTEV